MVILESNPNVLISISHPWPHWNPLQNLRGLQHSHLSIPYVIEHLLEQLCWSPWALHESDTTLWVSSSRLDRAGVHLKLQICSIWAVSMGQAEVFPEFLSSFLGHQTCGACSPHGNGRDTRSQVDTWRVFTLQHGTGTLSLLPTLFRLKKSCARWYILP